MRVYNIIVSIVLIILMIFIKYTIPQYESINVDPMADGQAGIGKAMVALMIFGSGVLVLLLALISILLMIKRPNARSLLGYINLFVSILISALTLSYILG